MNDMNQEQQQTQEAKEQQTQQDQQEVVTLDAQTYQALLDQLNYLESQLEEKKQGKDDDDDDELGDLLKDVKAPTQQTQPQEVDLDSMSRQELVQYTIQQIAEGIVTPLAVALEEIKINQEIDRLTRDERYKDFWDYKDEIYRIAKENPGLSLKRVYHLAKAEVEERKKQVQTDDAKKGRSREALLRHLPPVNAFGERPSGAPRSTTREEEPKSLKEAAEKAFDEVMKGFKE